MKSIDGVGLADVQRVYGGPEGKLWELIMGEQIHIGGLKSSMDLADRAGIRPGGCGVDLCCCTGAGMRFLVRFRQVARMQGVDATPEVVELGRQRCRNEGMEGRIAFTLADVCASGLPRGAADFVWGEDAWCYVADKRRLISEAAGLAKKGGTVAFTDWVEGRNLSDAEAARYLRFMKFPSILTLDDYSRLLKESGCQVEVAEDTGRFAPYVDLYMAMLDRQLTYDALRIIGFDAAMMEALAGEMAFMAGLAKDGKIAQGLLVAKRVE